MDQMKAAIALAIVLVFLSRALAAPSTRSATTEFTSSEHRLRFKYPVEWIVPERPLQGAIFSAQIPPAGDISLRIDRSNQNSPDAAILMDVADALASVAFKSGGKHVTIKPDQLGDLPARRITVQSGDPPDTVQAVYIVAVKDRVEYVFHFAGPAKLLDSQLPAINEMLKSFELLD
jgi:hypothetical protein